LIDPRPGGRTYAHTRRVRLGDVSPKGRLRLDAVARYLQDVAADDGHDAIGSAADPWVVRRTTLEVEQFPVLREHLTITTWAAGTGARWAERRTSLAGDRGGRVEAAALWVYVDMATGRPKKLSEEFWREYGTAVGDRTVHARLTHKDAPPADARRGPWTARFTDFDVLGHVNNALYWAMVEETADVRAPFTASIEYRGGLDRGQEVTLVADGRDLWILGDGVVAATGRLEGEGLYFQTP